MTRFDRTAALVTASLALAACDIDFVAVEEGPDAFATVRSIHNDAFGAEFRLDILPPAPRAVLLEGNQVPRAEDIGGRTVYRATIQADSLHPSLHLVIESHSGSTFETFIPLLARRGPAEWSSGRLRLPLVHGPSAEEPTHSLWSLVFRDSADTELLHVGSRTAPVPNPLLLDHGMVPEGAVEAEVGILTGYSIGEGSSGLWVSTSSRVFFTIP